MKTIKIKVNGEIPGYAKGGTFVVETDDEGIPLEQLWRRRLKDAETDNCCEVVASKPPAQDKNQPRRKE